MNWATLLSSPPPDTVWSFDSDAAIVLRRDRKLGNRCVAAQLSPEVFGVGSAGLQSVDVQLLKPVMERLAHSVGASRRPAIVLPTAWTRVFFIEGKELPTKARELEEIVRWRLKKLIPIPPSDLRLAMTEQKPVKEERRILCLVGMSKALDALEESFSALGTEPGLILPRILALALRGNDAPQHRLIIQQENGFLSLVLVDGENISFIRTKPLSQQGESLQVLDRELLMAHAFIRDELEIRENLEVMSIGMKDDARESLLERIKSLEGMNPSSWTWPDACPDPMLSQGIGEGHLEALAAVLEGGAP